MDKLRQIVETQETLAGKLFDFFFQFLIVISIISFSLETVPELEVYNKLFYLLELVIVILFTIEYALRLWCADKKFSFILSFDGLIDLVAILPFYISHGIVDLRFIRIFRLLRLFRAFKLLRYSKAITTFKEAFASIKNELIIFLIATLFILYLASAGIYYFEHEAQPEHFKSIFHSLWWSVATLTTVGYGDVYPITIGGKIFTFIILMVGLGIVSIPSGLLASALTKQKD